ncbi:MAG: ABC transporter permease subunit [Alphaproteobacteria bacterium]|nr:ABC transporter permease subunit [Alphaproteobacteria bacterium]
MTAAAVAAGGRTRRFDPRLLTWLVALAATVALYLVRDLIPWAFDYPKSVEWPLRFWISDFMKWLLNDASFGIFTFKEFTRSIAWVIEQPYWVAKSLLAQGFRIGVGSDAVEVFPRLSWLALIAVVALMGLYARDWKLSLMVGLCFLYLAVFGQWDSAMVTLSSIVIAVPFGVAGGLGLGILGFRSRRFEAAITPVLDLMQTVPVFAYLVPVLILFGFGPVAAMIATIIYATPPMVRVTMLGLRQVAPEVVEAGRMAGCTRRQLLWKVQIPSAKRSLMIGVNQVVMLSLNMVIIASMIGAGGLGFDVLTALKRLKIGEGIEAGVAITLLAIALDRLSQAFANRPQPQRDDRRAGLLGRHPYLITALAVMAVTWLLGLITAATATYPEAWQITTGTFWGDVVKWINVNFFEQLDAVKSFLLLNVMIPFKRFLLTLPWVAVVGLVALAGLQLGGWRLALLTGALALFIAVVGQWEKAMISVYLCGIAVVIASLIGIPIGIMAARNERLHRIVQVMVDTLQTLPSFVYLMPAVMLFRVGDFSAMLAVTAYALAPAIRYTDHGIRKVPTHLIEAAKTSGCTRRQILWKVQMPLALPEIMLGVNQTIMMGLSMLVITALVGTRDLGQEVYIALTKADTGRGIVAGLCVAFIAIIADRLIGAWANRRKAELGME